MEPAALAPYERALRDSSALALRTDDGRTIALDTTRWLGDVDAGDLSVLERCVGPVVDIGCGPGRLAAWLARREVAVLGLDIAETAVALTQARGAIALRRSVFARIPGEGRWPTALLIDGNIGIGGDPLRLLDRVHEVLAPGGTVLVEVHPDPAADELVRARFTEGGTVSGPVFGWALVGSAALARYAAGAGYTVRDTWTAGGRTFLALARR